MRRLALLVVCLSFLALVGYMSFWRYARAHVQSWLDEAWRRAAEGEALVAAIDKYRDDHGAYPGDQLEGLCPSYVAEIHPAWVLLPYQGETSLYFTFGIVEWTLEFNFSNRRWKLNGRPLEETPRTLPWFPWQDAWRG